MARVSYESGVSISATIPDEDVPKGGPGRRSVYTEVIEAIIDNTRGTTDWVELDTGGRKATSVQTSIRTVAKNMGEKIEVRVNKDRVLARAF